MLSDRFRWVKLLLLSSVLVALCLSNYLTAPGRLEADIQERIRRPAEQTQPLQVGFARVLHVGEAGAVRLLVWGRQMDAWHEGASWKAGDVVSFFGWFTPQGRIHVTSFTLHGERRLKKLFSLLAAVVLVAALILRASSWKTRREGACRT